MASHSQNAMTNSDWHKLREKLREESSLPRLHQNDGSQTVSFCWELASEKAVNKQTKSQKTLKKQTISQRHLCIYVYFPLGQRLSIQSWLTWNELCISRLTFKKSTFLCWIKCVFTTGLPGTLNIRENCNLLSYDWGNLLSPSSTVTDQSKTGVTGHLWFLAVWEQHSLFMCTCVLCRLSAEPRGWHMLLQCLHVMPKCPTVRSGQSFSYSVCSIYIYRKQRFSDLRRWLQT